MPLLIIHLTDAHLDQASAAFCDRAEAIVDAALSPMVEVSAAHIVFSGDLANKTAPADFDVARSLLEKMKSRIKHRLGVEPRVLLVAGNHDCDFSGDQSVRDALLSVARAKPQAISESIVEQLSSSLSGFYGLQDEVSPDRVVLSRWCATLDAPEGRVRYVLLNSSVMSSIKEEPGRLFVPLPDLEFEEGTKTIFVMHHPYGWLMPDNARELAQHAAMLGDLFLMGHEHELWAQQVSDLYDDSSITYLRGHVLRDPADQSNSAFQTVLVDPQIGFQPRSYIWRNGVYEAWLEKSREGFVSWPATNGGRKVSISSEGFKYLNSAGANFTHRRKEVITLQDIFVWPKLKRASPEKDTGNLANDGLTLDADSLVDASDLPPVCVVKGGEQSGKSALAKMLTMQLAKRNYYPLHLNAPSVSSWRPQALEERIEAAIDMLYGKKWRAEYKKIDVSERVLVIDDFDLLQAEKSLQGLRALRQHFGHIYLMIDSNPGMEVALSEFLQDENFIDSAVFEILPSTHHHRLEMIERWLMIGSDNAGGLDDLKVTAAKLLKVVDETLGRNLIPAAPIFVLIILQRAELAQDLNTVVKSGSHGFLYESLIAQALSVKVTVCNVVTSMTYLTALAKLLDLRGAEEMDQVDFELFHVSHCQKFNLKLSVAALQRQLVDADIVDERAGRIRFKYPYHYYYFLARSIAQVVDWTVLEPRIDLLVKTIHTERSANVLLFLAHLGRNPKIAEKILDSASRMFHGHGEADLFSRSSVLEKYRPMEIRQILFEGSKSAQLEQRALDESDAEAASTEIAKVAEERLKAKIDDALLLNAAFKTLQVLGQVLRNHAGEIEREDKHTMAESCVSLGLRLLGFLYQMVESHGDELLVFRGMQIKAEKSGISDTELADELEAYLPSMLSTLTMGTLIKIANAIGSEDLSLTIDDVLDGSDTRRLVKLVAHLEHFSEFPKKELLDFEEDALRRGPVLPNSVLRRFIIRRFYLFPVRDELKRAVLTRFGIRALPFQFLEQKRLPKMG